MNLLEEWCCMTLTRRIKKRFKFSKTKTRNFDDPQYVKWRKAVYKRDGYKCKWPKCKARTRLNAHHIRRWADCPSLRFEINNGITLCKKHHKMIQNKEDIFAMMFIQLLQVK